MLPLTLCLCLFAPAGILWACKRAKPLNALGPVVVAYILGILWGNGAELAGIELDSGVVETFAGVAVMLAIALLLLSSDFRAWLRLAPVTLKGFGLALLSVAVVVPLGTVLIPMEEGWRVGGMLVGVYTGGTANLMALAAALDVAAETLLLVHGSDVVVGGAYLLFLLSVGPRLYARFLPPFEGAGAPTEAHPDTQSVPERPTARQIALGVALGLGVLVVGLGIAAAADAMSERALLEPVAILAITSLAIAASFVRRVRAQPGTAPAGDYLLLVFSLGVGTLARASVMQEADLRVVAFTGFVVLGSAALHLLLCRLAGVDRDTAIITSVAGLYGPPFVPPMAKALGNREVIVSGITTGILGLALGNYLGMGMAWLLRSLL